MTQRPVTNLGASVRQRLLNLARQRGEPFDQLLQYYAIERFLARLAATHWASVLVVKGATLLRVWDAPLARPTRDIDFHTRLPDAADTVQAAVAATFAGRGTELPMDAPVALTAEFAEQVQTQASWSAFVAKPGVEGPASFVLVLRQIDSFLMPVVNAVLAGRNLEARWAPGGPWEPSS